MRLTVISAAYPLAPVRADAVGGAEQVLARLDRGLTERGHRSIVIACEGSHSSGELVTIPHQDGPLNDRATKRAVDAQRRTIEDTLSRCRADVLHLHGLDFEAYLPPPGTPVLATIHLPPELLVSRLARIHRARTWFSGVSWPHHRRLPQVPNLLPPIDNGVGLEELRRPLVRRRFAVALGRVCPEKGFHLAARAARRAGVPLLLGGIVFPYPVHQEYFERELRPELDRERRFLGPLSTRARRRLLNSARCLLVPSRVPETSSLVAMEALACGTPVVAFAVGALPDIIEDGVTGFLVEDEYEMAAAIQRVDEINPERCRERARARFSEEQMIEAYLERYRWMLSQDAESPGPVIA